MLGRSRRPPAEPPPATPAESGWLLLVAALPTGDANARMAALRTIESLGAAILRDGVYVLPDAPAHRASLERLVAYLRSVAGDGHLMAACAYDAAQEADFRRRLDRGGRFAEVFKIIESVRQGIGHADPGAIAKVLQKQRSEFEALVAIDFLHSPFQARVAAALSEAERELSAFVFPDGVKGGPRAESRNAYFRKIWATRKPLWVDRLACAWIIRRFIDAEAELRWLDRDAEPPRAAITFGFEGARFANTSERVTFEELIRCFGLARDVGLVGVAGVVKALTIGDTSLPAANNLEKLLRGAQLRAESEADVVNECERAFDLVYDSFVEMPADATPSRF